MQAIQVLMDEHRVIERALDALVAYAEAAGRGEDVPRADLGRLARFFREYADALHHGKEEDILFREMVAHGMSREMGPLAVMLHEHTEGRRLTQQLAHLADGAEPIPPADATRIRNAATAYAALLREHIQKEDLVLYPMAQQVLPPGAWRSIESTFGHFAAGADAAKRSLEMVALVDELSATYGSVRSA